MLNTKQKYGRWSIIGKREKVSSAYMWKCRCDCGTEKMVNESHLKRGNTQSCGCYKKEVSVKTNTTHGLVNHPLYKKWSGMKRRCKKYNPNSHLYSEKGIVVCDRWKNSFKNFYDDMIESWIPGLTLDRIDSNGNYEPNNCRWATYEEQANNMSVNHKITFNGKTQNLSQWAREIGLEITTLERRINSSKWSYEKALTTPLRGS